jgi:hypothetical protein
MEFFKGAQHKRAAGKTMIDAGTREVSHDGSAIFEKRMLPPGALFLDVLHALQTQKRPPAGGLSCCAVAFELAQTLNAPPKRRTTYI